MKHRLTRMRMKPHIMEWRGYEMSFALIALLLRLVYLAAFVAGIYLFVLVIKLAHRGIIALDLYIDEKRRTPRL